MSWKYILRIIIVLFLLVVIITNVISAEVYHDSFYYARAIFMAIVFGLKISYPS